MAKLTQEEIDEIIKRDAPGHRVVQYEVGEDAAPTPASPDEGTPDLAGLKRRYLGKEPNPGGEDAVVASLGDKENDDIEDQFVAIAPEAAPNPWDHGSKPKVVVISGKDKRIIASQG
jgi:hypothetical protein